MSDLGGLARLTIGATLVCCALAVAGVQAYAAGKAQRRALVDRLTETPAPPPAGRVRRFAAF
ncbi:hypothetical protein ADK38_48110, partial [Streptomyces varsoviensis]